MVLQNCFWSFMFRQVTLGHPRGYQGAGMGLWRPLGAPSYSKPCGASLGTRHNALSKHSRFFSPRQIQHSCTKRNKCVLTVKLSVSTRGTDGIVLLIKCMLLNALKEIGMQNYEERLVQQKSVTCKMLFHFNPSEGERQQHFVEKKSCSRST